MTRSTTSLPASIEPPAPGPFRPGLRSPAWPHRCSRQGAPPRLRVSLRPQPYKLTVSFRDVFRQPFDLIKKDTRQFHDEKRKRCRLILDRFFKNFYIRRSLRSHDAVLRQMTAECVDQLRALPDQKIPRPEQHGARLLSLGLNRDKAHHRSTCSLSNRFRVSRIVLLTLDERFDVGGWDQSNLMPEVTDGPPPVVRAPTGFQGDDAARLLGKEAENFLSGKLFAEPDAAVGKGAKRLERPLGKIET